MDNSIDNIKINFSADNLLILNVILAFLMFAIALDIKREDFELLWKNPKPALVGMTAQLILMPLMTLLLVFIFKTPPSVSLGMIAISACPGGNNSNYTTYLAKGNTALAVTTTSISVIVCIVTMPLYIWIGTKVIPNMGSLNRVIYLDPFDMAKIIGLLILAPLLMGMLINSRFHNLANIIKRPFKIVALILFFGLIVGAMASNFNNIVNYVSKVFVIVMVLNLCALGIGYWFAKFNKLSEADSRAITFETGIHNVTLALIIVFNFFGGLGGMALVAAWYGIWDLLTGFGLAMWWNKSTKLETALSK